MANDASRTGSTTGAGVRCEAQHTPDEERFALARAKNTARAEARRRHRQAQTLATNESDPTMEVATEEVAEPAPRRRFALPDVRGDLRALPHMLLTRKRLWVPFVLVVVAFIVGMAQNRAAFAPPVDDISELFVQLVLPTLSGPPLLIFFLAGFMATRGSYLVGFLLGLVAGPLQAIHLWDAIGAQVIEAAAPLSFEGLLATYTVQGALYGMLAAGFAAWYRGFLRSSQERGRQNRIAREQQALQKRKEAEREARRAGSTRRTTNP